MPWRTMDVQQQRVEFVTAAKRGAQSFRSLCEEFGISRPAGYLWLHRYEQEGLRGIAERSRRPLGSPRRTAADLEKRVVEVRHRYPDWGARKLRVVLAREGVHLARNTIHGVLLRNGLVKECDQHSPALQRFERERPNQLWQMDFKGPKGWPQPVGPLSVLDDHSRYVVVLAANGNTEGQPVREQLERAFQNCGVPEAMLMGSRHTVVEAAITIRENQAFALADAPRDTVVLEQDTAPSDAGQSGAVSRIAAASAEPGRNSAAASASMAGRLSLGAQPCTAP
jgi:transposase